jgi:hypothetical protein
MAVIVSVIVRGVTREQYDQVRATVGWLERTPEGAISHVTWWEGGDCHNIDAWESEAAFQAFAEQRLGPGMAQVGVQKEPEVTLHQAHEVYLPKAATIKAS